MNSLHSNTDHAIRCVPEADFTGVRAALRWPPGHSDDEDLDEDEEDQKDVPDLEVSASSAHTLVMASDKVQPDTQGQMEETVGIRL